MVNGNSGTLTMRLVRSKLRKREESLSVPPTTNTTDAEVQDSITNNREQTDAKSISNGPNIAKEDQRVTFVRTKGTNTNDIGLADVVDGTEWTFPPKLPTPHIYNCINPELLVAGDKHSFKGFRKQFSGRFKRLVARKPEPVPVIPPELKPQLKTIYVY